MSITRLAGWVTYTLTAPPVPAGTMAAFALTAPVGAFSVETNGCVCPAGHVVRYDNGPEGTAVMFNEYAWAAMGI